MIEQCNEKQLINISAPKTVADFIFVLVDGAYLYLSLENDKKASTERLEYYKNKAYQVLGIDNSICSGGGLSA
jgi:hypothetical protein